MGDDSKCRSYWLALLPRRESTDAFSRLLVCVSASTIWTASSARSVISIWYVGDRSANDGGSNGDFLERKTSSMLSAVDYKAKQCYNLDL